MKRLVRYCTGYVRLQISGKNAGRFLNLCAKNDIHIWNVRRIKEDEYSCYMAKRDVWPSRPYFHKTKTRVRILQKQGIPFLLFRYRKRILFPIALLAVIYLFGYCSQFIWKIEVNGNSYLTEESIIKYLEEKQASFGTRKSAIDCDSLELSLREDFAQIIWASVAIEGTDLIIELQEKNPEGEGASKGEIETAADPASTEETTPERQANGYCIIATKDGIVDSVITRRGIAVVKAGDEVKAGDVLVEGTQEVLNDNGEVKFWYYASADADIIGTVTYEYTDSIPEQEIQKDYGKEHFAGGYLEIAGKRLELPWPFHNKEKEKTEVLESCYQLHLSQNFYLPVGIGVYKNFWVKEQEMILSKEQARDRAEKNLRKFIENLEENGVLIIEKNVIMDKVGENYQVSGTITAQEKIGTLIPDSQRITDMEGTVDNEHE